MVFPLLWHPGFNLNVGRTKPVKAEQKEKNANQTDSSSSAHYRILKTFLNYIWPAGNPKLKRRVVLAFSFLVGAKVSDSV